MRVAYRGYTMAKQINKVVKVTGKAKAKPAVASMDIKALNEGKAKSHARIEGIIKKVKGYSKSLHTEIALGAALIVIHAVAYKDVSAATRLIEAMGPGMRGNDMRSWFIEFGPMKWGDTKATDKEGNKIKGFTLDNTKRDALLPRIATAEGVREFGSEMQKNSYWVWKKEPAFKPFDMVAVIEAAIKQGDKRLKDKDPRDNVIGIEVFRKALLEAQAVKAKAMAEAKKDDAIAATA
jgi:hypothetical protein